MHGDEGSLIGRDCMTQAPKGEVVLRTAAGEEALKLEHENLYVRSVRLFQGAVAGTRRAVGDRRGRRQVAERRALGSRSGALRRRNRNRSERLRRA